MNLIPKEVKITSVEEPVSYLIDGAESAIIEIIDRWYQGDNNPDYPEAVYYKVITSDSGILILKHEVGESSWYICSY